MSGVNAEGSTPRAQRRVVKRSAELGAILLLSVLPLGLLEVGLRLGGYGDPAVLLLPAPGDTEYLSVNRSFADVYLPPSLEQTLKPGYIRKQKTEKTYRIFVLGASAAVGFPDYTTGFSRKLDVMLRHSFRDLEIEVVNFATAAINSHVVFDIAKHSVAFEPDLFLVYLGNNEVIGPFGPTGKITLSIDNIHLVRAIGIARHLRVSQWLSSLMPDSSSGREWRGMQTFLDNPLRHSDPRLEAVYANFRQNLTDIRRITLASGAKIVFSSVVSNTEDFAPLASEHRPDITQAELAQWQRHFQKGSLKLLRGDFRASIIELKSAMKLDDEHAELHFKLGTAYLASGDRELAREHLTRARDLDTLKFRADSRINTIIKDVASTDKTGRVHYVDPTSFTSDGMPGFDVFLEHVHFNSTGNDLLAAIFFETVKAIIAGDTGSVAGAMDLTSEDLSNAVLDVAPLNGRALHILKGVLSKPPFSLRRRNHLRLRSVQEQLDHVESVPFTMTDSILKTLRSDPDDILNHRKVFDYLEIHARRSMAANDLPRVRLLLDSIRELLKIRGQNEDLNLLRSRWSQKVSRFLEEKQ